ncbi:hypothetical protein ACKLNR_009639 [Fusarium oxysporum f. sp. zingiberi]
MMVMALTLKPSPRWVMDVPGRWAHAHRSRHPSKPCVLSMIPVAMLINRFVIHLLATRFKPWSLKGQGFLERPVEITVHRPVEASTKRSFNSTIFIVALTFVLYLY